jgi:glycosyltransferase involved in cell wall biosynthesis
MALEVPIVASSIPAMGEVLDDATASLVPSEQPGKLADAILATLLEPQAARTRAALAKECFLKGFTLDRVVDRMMLFYERALSRH